MNSRLADLVFLLFLAAMMWVVYAALNFTFLLGRIDGFASCRP